MRSVAVNVVARTGMTNSVRAKNGNRNGNSNDNQRMHGIAYHFRISSVRIARA
jgi:hypothetical protein